MTKTKKKKSPFSDLRKTSHYFGKLQAKANTEENYDPFKVHDIILESKKKKIEHEIHMQKFPRWQVADAKLIEDLHPPTPNALPIGENLV